MKLGDKYYSGREVQKKLGITEPALRNLVNQKRIKKVIPPGREYGVYLKTEIDRYAEKWEAFLMAKEPPKTIFRIARSEDMPQQEELDTRAIGPGGLSTERLKELSSVNGDINFHVYHDNNLVAYISLVPLKQAKMEQLLQEKIQWRDIKPKEDIEKYEPGKPVNLYVLGIAGDPNIDETTRQHYMLVLLRGVGDELKKLGRQGIIIKKVYGRSQTPTGIAMALHIGMKEYEPLPRTGKLIRFELDVDTSNTFLAKMYREGFQEWQEEQKKQERQKKNKHTSSEKGKDNVSSLDKNAVERLPA